MFLAVHDQKLLTGQGKYLVRIIIIIISFPFFITYNMMQCFTDTHIAYQPLTEQSIRDFWDRMFLLCKQEDSLQGWKSGNKPHKSQAKRMHRRYKIIYTQVPTVRQSRRAKWGCFQT